MCILRGFSAKGFADVSKCDSDNFPMVTSPQVAMRFARDEVDAIFSDIFGLDFPLRSGNGKPSVFLSRIRPVFEFCAFSRLFSDDGSVERAWNSLDQKTIEISILERIAENQAEFLDSDVFPYINVMYDILGIDEWICGSPDFAVVGDTVAFVLSVLGSIVGVDAVAISNRKVKKAA